MAEQKPDEGLDVEETTDNPLASAAPAGDGSTRVVSNPISNVIDTSGGGAPAKSKVPLIAGAVAGVVVLIIIAVLAMGGDDAAEAPPLPPGRSAGTSTAPVSVAPAPPPMYEPGPNDVVFTIQIEVPEEVLVPGADRDSWISTFRSDMAGLVQIDPSDVNVISIVRAATGSSGRRRLAMVLADVTFAMTLPRGQSRDVFPANFVVDCAGGLAPANWIEDGVCDKGLTARPGGKMPNFDCAQHRFDGTDCVGVCSPGDVPDCRGSCVSEDWIGDVSCKDLASARLWPRHRQAARSGAEVTLCDRASATIPTTAST